MTIYTKLFTPSRPFIKASFPSGKLRSSISYFNMALLVAGYLKTRRNEIEMSGNRKHFRELTTQHTYTYQPLALLGPSAYQPGQVSQ
ncbi:MAG: hypothetical protein QOK48_3731 [Blastocatellia bacterium]|jgi:hypothetical protein|nr:hypothetical protein [Blastocatellia bacterium]